MSRGVALAAAMLALALPTAARADLGPHEPSVCEGKVAGEACRSGGTDGTCVQRTVGRRRTLVCAPPLDPSAYPPVADPYASSSARPAGSATPPPASSSSSAPTPDAKGCGCVVGASGESTAAITAAVIAVGAAFAARRRRVTSRDG